MILSYKKYKYMFLVKYGTLYYGSHLVRDEMRHTQTMVFDNWTKLINLDFFLQLSNRCVLLKYMWEKKLKKKIFYGVYGEKIIIALSHLVPDEMIQLIRPIQPIMLTKMSQMLGVTQAQWGNNNSDSFFVLLA